MRRLFGRRRRDERVNDERDTDVPQDDSADGDSMDEYGTEEFEAFVPVEREYEAYEPHDDAGAYHDDVYTGDADDAGAYDIYRADVDGAGDDIPYTAPAASEAADAPRRRVRVPRPRLPRVDLRGALRWDVLLAAAALVALGIFGTLLVQDRLSGDIVTLWPLALVAAAVAWLLVALLRRHVTSFLGAATLAGVGLSALMETQEVAPIEETLLGVVLVTIGLGIVIRGFLLRTRDMV
jgi:hypothetical protein